MGHVNNAVFLRWVQEAVTAQWAKIARSEDIARHLWVALKHEITYRRAAFVDDQIIAIAELEHFRGARSTYRTQIKRGSDVLAEALSQWCSIDVVTGKPLRLARDLVGNLQVPLP